MANSRAVWTFADQAVSSLSTAVLSIVIARSVSESEFGAFGAGLLIYTFLVGVARALISDPLVIRFSARSAATHRRAARMSTGAALFVGALCGVVVAGASFADPSHADLPTAMRMTGLALPFLLLQDAYRYTFFSMGAPARAFLCDLSWAVVQFGVLAAVLHAGAHHLAWLMLCWALGAATASALAMVQMRSLPQLAAGPTWLRDHWDLTSKLGLDFAVNQGAYNGSVLLVGRLDRLESVGALSAARTLLGPLQLLSSGTSSFVLPTMARRRDRESLRRPAITVGGVLGGAAACWTAVLVFMPQEWGYWLLRENWAGARQVLPATGWTIAMSGFSLGAALGLKAREHAGALLSVTLVQAPLFVILGAVGAIVHGAVGGAMGFAAAQTVGCLMTWLIFLRREPAGAPVPA